MKFDKFEFSLPTFCIYLRLYDLRAFLFLFNFLIVMENITCISNSFRKCTKIHSLGKSWNIDTLTFPKVQWLSGFHQILIQWGMKLHRMRNTWDLPRNSFSLEKRSKSHLMGMVRELKIPYFPCRILRRLFLALSWRRPISYRNGANQWTGFYIISASVVKGLKGYRCTGNENTHAHFFSLFH